MCNTCYKRNKYTKTVREITCNHAPYYAHGMCRVCYDKDRQTKMQRHSKNRRSAVEDVVLSQKPPLKAPSEGHKKPGNGVK